MTATDATAEYIKRKYARATLPLMEADAELEKLCVKYAELNSVIVLAEKEKEDVKVLIQGALKESEGCQFSGGKITWKEVNYKGKCNWEKLAYDMGATEDQVARHMGDGKTIRSLKFYPKKGI
jgi:predicted phage-related endonuclease